MIVVPEEYVVQKFFQYCGSPKHNRYNKTYQGSCPICREGRSWLKKRRCYYIPKNNNIFCHNCGWSSAPLNWILHVSRLSFAEIKQELEHLDTTIDPEPAIESPVINTATLPHDSINLFDKNQIEFYADNTIVQRALEFISARRLNTAINKPQAFYLSLTDKVHRNRLIIPFIDGQGKITHYQSRTLLKADERIRPRYMSKQGSEKTLFNFNQINSTIDTVYIFEGPLNACFTQNGIAVAGIQDDSHKTFTPKQQAQIQSIPFYDRVWVLDSQWVDQAARNKSKILAASGEAVFIWPEKIGTKFKDFNDIAIAGNIDEISIEFIQRNTFRSLTAEVRLRSIG